MRLADALGRRPCPKADVRSTRALIRTGRELSSVLCYFRTVTTLDDRTARQIGARVRAARRESGLTQTALSRAVRIGRTALARLESGDRRMSAAEAIRFARVLRLSIPSLLGEDGDPGPSDIGALVRAKRREIRRICARHGATEPRLFGSVARGDAGPNSDVDFLVELAPDRTLFDLVGLQNDLADLLGRPVDVGTTRMLKSAIRERVLRDAVPL